ncbi:hypothetical protein RHI9324_04049 [Rhizobium sp. CECT 9324]|nr:hypothetical protein RHI9324_04049 [Rhizobium sp. CECT 9324]
MCMSLDRRTGPDLVSWGSGDHLALKDVQTISFDGDRVHRPASVLTASPSGSKSLPSSTPQARARMRPRLRLSPCCTPPRTASSRRAGWTVTGEDPEGDRQPPGPVQRDDLSRRGGLRPGHVRQLLQPHVKKAWEETLKQQPRHPEDKRKATEIVTERAKKQQKELRIIQTLEPVFAAHRLVWWPRRSSGGLRHYPVP